MSGFNEWYLMSSHPNDCKAKRGETRARLTSAAPDKPRRASTLPAGLTQEDTPANRRAQGAHFIQAIPLGLPMPNSPRDGYRRFGILIPPDGAGDDRGYLVSLVPSLVDKSRHP